MATSPELQNLTTNYINAVRNAIERNSENKSGDVAFLYFQGEALTQAQEQGLSLTASLFNPVSKIRSDGATGNVITQTVKIYTTPEQVKELQRLESEYYNNAIVKEELADLSNARLRKIESLADNKINDFIELKVSEVNIRKGKDGNPYTAVTAFNEDGIIVRFKKPADMVVQIKEGQAVQLKGDFQTKESDFGQILIAKQGGLQVQLTQDDGTVVANKLKERVIGDPLSEKSTNAKSTSPTTTNSEKKSPKVIQLTKKDSILISSIVQDRLKEEQRILIDNQYKAMGIKPDPTVFLPRNKQVEAHQLKIEQLQNLINRPEDFKMELFNGKFMASHKNATNDFEFNATQADLIELKNRHNQEKNSQPQQLKQEETTNEIAPAKYSLNLDDLHLVNQIANVMYKNNKSENIDKALKTTRDILSYPETMRNFDISNENGVYSVTNTKTGEKLSLEPNEQELHTAIQRDLAEKERNRIDSGIVQDRKKASFLNKSNTQIDPNDFDDYIEFMRDMKKVKFLDRALNHEEIFNNYNFSLDENGKFQVRRVDGTMADTFEPESSVYVFPKEIYPEMFQSLIEESKKGIEIYEPLKNEEGKVMVFGRDNTKALEELHATVETLSNADPNDFIIYSDIKGMARVLDLKNQVEVSHSSHLAQYNPYLNPANIKPTQQAPTTVPVAETPATPKVEVPKAEQPETPKANDTFVLKELIAEHQARKRDFEVALYNEYHQNDVLGENGVQPKFVAKLPVEKLEHNILPGIKREAATKKQLGIIPEPNYLDVLKEKGIEYSPDAVLAEKISYHQSQINAYETTLDKMWEGEKVFDLSKKNLATTQGYVVTQKFNEQGKVEMVGLDPYVVGIQGDFGSFQIKSTHKDGFTTFSGDMETAERVIVSTSKNPLDSLIIQSVDDAKVPVAVVHIDPNNLKPFLADIAKYKPDSEVMVIIDNNKQQILFEDEFGTQHRNTSDAIERVVVEAATNNEQKIRMARLPEQYGSSYTSLHEQLQVRYKELTDNPSDATKEAIRIVRDEALEEGDRMIQAVSQVKSVKVETEKPEELTSKQKHEQGKIFRL